MGSWRSSGRGTPRHAGLRPRLVQLSGAFLLHPCPCAVQFLEVCKVYNPLHEQNYSQIERLAMQYNSLGDGKLSFDVCLCLARLGRCVRYECSAHVGTCHVQVDMRRSICVPLRWCADRVLTA